MGEYAVQFLNDTVLAFGDSVSDLITGLGDVSSENAAIVMDGENTGVLMMLLTGAIPAFWLLPTLALVVNIVTVVIPSLVRRFVLRRPRNHALPRGVWTIHGKQYDLSSYAKHHPGGEWALELGRNRDCTGLFESYHVFKDRAVMFRILKKYETKDPSIVPTDESVLPSADPTGSPVGLTFGDAFHEDTKAMVRDHFAGGKSHKCKPGMAVVLVMIIASFFYTSYLVFCGSIAGLFLSCVLGWLMMGNIAHDGSHFAISKYSLVNQLGCYCSTPGFFAATSWYIQHVVQHHVYTNGENDVDLYHFLPVARMSRLTQYMSVNKAQWLTIFLVLPTACAHLCFVVPMDLLTGHVDPVIGIKRYGQTENLEDFVTRNEKRIWLDLFLCWGWVVVFAFLHGPIHAYYTFTWMYTINSIVFVVFTQGAHLHADCHGLSKDKSWAKHQANASINFLPESSIWGMISGALNIQSLHHVIPGVHSSHLCDLWPKYQIVCAKHGVVLKETTGVMDFVRGFLGWVRELATLETKED